MSDQFRRIEVCGGEQNSGGTVFAHTFHSGKALADVLDSKGWTLKNFGEIGPEPRDCVICDDGPLKNDHLRLLRNLGCDGESPSQVI